jgi:hypothetical protein
MPVCPTCEFEYEEGYRYCPECGARLTYQPRIRPAAQEPDDSWISIWRTGNGIKSNVAKGALDVNNIPSILMSSSLDSAGATGSKNPANQSSTEASILLVPREYREEAMIILQAVLGDDFTETDVR